MNSEKIKLNRLISKTISGVWGEDDEAGNGTYVIRAANFTNTGEIDYSKLVKRNLEGEDIEKKQLRDGDIIIEKSGGGPNTPVGRVVQFNSINNNPFLCNNFTAILRPSKELVHPAYLFYQLFYLYQIGKVRKYQNQTTGLYNLKLEKYLNEEVIIPPLATQSKITAQLSRIQGLIAKRKETIELWDKYLDFLFIEMFLENPESEKWNFDSMEKTNVISKSVYGTAKKANDEGKGIPVLRMNNISYSGDISLEEIKWVELEKDELRALKLENRSVLFNRTNSPDLVGKIGVWDKGSGYTYAGYLINLKLDEKRINPYFFSAYFNSNFGKKILQSKARPSGSLANISATTLKSQKILLPPIELQNKFEKFYVKVKRQQQRSKNSLALLESLLQIILYNTFSEKMEVDEEKYFEDILRDLTIDELKNEKHLQYILNWFQKKSQRFSNFSKYKDGYTKLMELLDNGDIEQYYEKKQIKLRLKK